MTWILHAHRKPKDKRMEYLNFLDLGVLTCKCRSDHRPKNQLLLCQRNNFNEWAQSAYLLVPVGDGIFYTGVFFTY